MDILNSLNNEQQQVVVNTKNNIRIIAGPGSGKTRTITHKIAYLINEKQIEPRRILSITFTNKASKEMKNRIFELIGESKTQTFTFHGFCAKLLYIESENTRFGSDFAILDRVDQTKILKTIYSKKELSSKEHKYNDILSKFSKYKETSLTLKQLKQNYANDELNSLYLEIYEKYLLEKANSNVLDFDDLLIETEKLLSSNLEVKEKWSNFFDFIFVDEYQDTNQIQFNILKLLKNKKNIINVVGDPDQNIYSWRGAEMKFILDFDKHFEDTITISLNINYRSNQSIVDLSNKLISQNKNRLPNIMEASNKSIEKVFIYNAEDKYQEADKVVNNIESLRRRKPNIKIAVMYRNAFSSLPIEQKLMFKGYKYVTVGSFRFAERKEIKEVMQYILFIIKYDDLSLSNIINIPSRKIGPMFFDKLNNLKTNGSFNTIWEAIKDSQEPLIKKNKLLSDFIEQTKLVRKEIIETQNPPHEIIKTYLKKIGYYDYYKTEENRIGNINEFLDMLKEFSKTSEEKNARKLLLNFINENQLFSAADQEESGNAIILTTIHASKGTEYDAVMLVNFNEGILPSSRAETIAQLEEERRLTYVAFTRARKYLFIFYNEGKDWSGNFAIASSFLVGIREKLVEQNNNLSNNQNIGDNENSTINYFVDNKIEVGDKIYHNSFGEGKVLEFKGKNIIVRFNNFASLKEIIKNHNSVRRIK